MPGSKCGYHFIQKYLQCPRSWFLQYMLGYEEKSKKYGTCLGTAWHQGLKEGLSGYIGRSVPREDFPTVAEVIRSGIQGSLTEQWLHGSSSAISQLMSKVFTKEYIEHYLERLCMDYYTIIYVEKDLSRKTFLGIPATGTIDLLLGERSSTDTTYVLFDHKTTTGWKRSALKELQHGDQMTMYRWLLGGELGVDAEQIRVYGAETKLPKEDEYRSPELSIEYIEGPDDFMSWEGQVTGLLLEMFQKYSTMRSAEGTVAEMLFPRNGTFCSLFGCPYEDICRKNLLMGERFPGLVTNPELVRQTEEVFTDECWAKVKQTGLFVYRDLRCGVLGFTVAGAVTRQSTANLTESWDWQGMESIPMYSIAQAGTATSVSEYNVESNAEIASL